MKGTGYGFTKNPRKTLTLALMKQREKLIKLS